MTVENIPSFFNFREAQKNAVILHKKSAVFGRFQEARQRNNRVYWASFRAL